MFGGDWRRPDSGRAPWVDEIGPALLLLRLGWRALRGVRRRGLAPLRCRLPPGRVAGRRPRDGCRRRRPSSCAPTSPRTASSSASRSAACGSSRSFSGHWHGTRRVARRRGPPLDELHARVRRHRLHAPWLPGRRGRRATARGRTGRRSKRRRRHPTTPRVAVRPGRMVPRTPSRSMPRSAPSTRRRARSAGRARSAIRRFGGCSASRAWSATACTWGAR